MNFEVGDEPPSVAAYRADGTKPPAADLTGIYARFPIAPSSDELAAGTTAWLNANKPGVLDSKVEKAFREREWLIVWTPPYCPKFQPIELVWGAGKERASGLWLPNRDLETTRLHLRMGFYGGKDSQGATWGPVNIAGCWARAEKEMDKWIAVDKDRADGGLTVAITDIHGVGNWTTSGDDCLDITDLECPRDPEPHDATALYRDDSNLAKVPLAHGISTPRSMNFELGFGVCLNKTKVMLGLPAKPLIERLRSSTEYLIFKFS